MAAQERRSEGASVTILSSATSPRISDDRKSLQRQHLQSDTASRHEVRAGEKTAGRAGGGKSL